MDPLGLVMEVLQQHPEVKAWRIREEVDLGHMVIECTIRGYLCQRLLSYEELTFLTLWGLRAEMQGWLDGMVKQGETIKQAVGPVVAAWQRWT